MAEVYRLDDYRRHDRPRLWSDFDGTAVEHLPKYDPRNWLKYPLPGKEGYLSFLYGAKRGGLELGGIVSRRPEIRRAVTLRSMAKLGIDHYFDAKHAFHFGSEERKAEHIVAESVERKVALVDDRPDKFGKYLVRLMKRHASGEHAAHPIVVGVVNHEDSQEYIARMHDDVRDLGLRSRYAATGGEDFQVEVGDSHLLVRQLLPFSEIAGRTFADQVKAAPLEG